MNANEAKKIPLEDLLASQGIFPGKRTKNELWYKLRNENVESCKISIPLNLWFDFGIGKGGNGCDLAMLLWNCSLSVALEKISKINFKNIPHEDSVIRTKIDVPHNYSIEILSVDTINDIKLCNYIVNVRKVYLHEVRRFAKEITYKSGNGLYKAIGIPTVENGWETITTSGFKTSTSPKSVSFFKQNKVELAVFEGMFDE